ncbi:hypothetical protein H2200_000420 [Cladophialophora chaetospira]|uniref:Uncharacterized protein n=1 Tax=Cladophialophora chaetospira TaxID=386627 RepID=A0AA38XP86_9EURO|nr:hypothetical protein H2200_000420 [Cladophialophora chaetospira]
MSTSTHITSKGGSFLSTEVVPDRIETQVTADSKDQPQQAADSPSSEIAPTLEVEIEKVIQSLSTETEIKKGIQDLSTEILFKILSGVQDAPSVVCFALTKKRHMNTVLAHFKVKKLSEICPKDVRSHFPPLLEPYTYNILVPTPLTIPWLGWVYNWALPMKYFPLHPQTLDWEKIGVATKMAVKIAGTLDS